MNNRVGVPAIDKIAHITNGAPNTKQAIIGTASFDEILRKEIENIKAKERNKEKESKKDNELDFDPKEIQTLVYRNKEGSER